MTEREAYWSAHLAAIEREGITTRAYAAREGLSVAALYQWRRDLKARRRAQSAKGAGFVAVTVPSVAAKSEPGQSAACRVHVGDGVTLELSAVPTAQWVAALCAELVGGR